MRESLPPSIARTPAWGHPEQALEKVGHKKNLNNSPTMKVTSKLSCFWCAEGSLFLRPDWGTVAVTNF